MVENRSGNPEDNARIIKSTGCSSIQEGIKVIEQVMPLTDLSEGTLQKMADFVKTSPPDTEAAPKR